MDGEDGCLSVRWDEVPVISVDQLRTASESFKLATTKIDGWHLRQYGLLPDRALEAQIILSRQLIRGRDILV